MSCVIRLIISFMIVSINVVITFMFKGKLLVVQALQHINLKVWQGRGDSWYEAYILCHESPVTSFSWCTGPDINKSPFVMMAM